MFNLRRAIEILEAADVFYENNGEYELNMNDVWCWACSMGEKVPEKELPEVARLFYFYGWCGILYWVSKRNVNLRSEFHDNNRFIDFVAQEEELRTQIPDSNKRAYTKIKYTIG